MRIYITHCSARKSDSARRKGRAVRPDVLYTSQRTQRFMRRCRERGVRWAIVSDEYGVWFPPERRHWYEKSPDQVSEAEFRRLVANFDRRLRRFREIRFYYHPGRFHWRYGRLLRATGLRHRIRRFRHLTEIA